MKNVYTLGVLNFWKLNSKPAHEMRDRASKITSILLTFNSNLVRFILFIYSNYDIDDFERKVMTIYAIGLGYPIEKAELIIKKSIVK